MIYRRLAALLAFLILALSLAIPATVEAAGAGFVVAAPRSPARIAQERAAMAAGHSYLVTFKADVPLSAIQAVLQDEAFETIGPPDIRLIRLITDNIGSFRHKAAGLCESVEPDRARKANLAANDPRVSQQWSFDAVNIPEAWDITTGSSVLVAVIDSGVDRTHPDLDGADIRPGWDYVHDTPCLADSYGHGTRVTSIIAAETNNGEGMAGICWNVGIVPLQVVDESGYIAESDVIAAIYGAVDAGCKVINLSLGGEGYSAAEEAAVDYAAGLGCIIVAASGNSGSTAFQYPASFESAISVGSTGSDGSWSTFSTYNSQVDVCAPGEAILTASDADFSPYSDYVYASGTSFAAPCVAGIAALAASLRPDLTGSQFQELLAETSLDLGDAGKDAKYGYGLVQADALLYRLLGSANTRLASLTVSGASLEPEFAGSRTSYAASLPASAETFTITAASLDSNAAVAIDGIRQGSLTLPSPGQGSVRQVVVSVTAENQIDTQVYTLEIYRRFGDFTLTVSNPELNFDGHVIAGEVGRDTGQLTLDLAADRQAAIACFRDAACTLPAGLTLDLAEGENWYYLKVSAEDPAHYRIIPVAIFRASADPVPRAPLLIVQDGLTGRPASPGAFISSPVRVTVIGGTSPQPSASLNGSLFAWPSDGLFCQDGEYRVSVTDVLGQTAEVSFNVDQTSPAIAVTANGARLSSGAFTRYSAAISVSDANLAASALKMNGCAMSWPAGGLLSAAGSYSLTAVDRAGNQASFSLTIDKTPPVITVRTAGGLSVADGITAVDSIVVSISEPNLSSKSVRKNGTAVTWPANDTFTTDGTYSLTVSDKAGNTSTRTVMVCKTLPVIRAVGQDGKLLASNDYIRQDATITVTGWQLKTKAASRDGTAIIWPAGGLFSLAGKYVITGTLLSGARATFNLTIDKTVPAIAARTSIGTTLASGALTRYSVTVTASDSNLASCSVTRSGSAMTWPSGNLFTIGGTYTVTALDKAGNSRTFTFEIDKTRPTIKAVTGSGIVLASGASTNDSVTVSVSDKNLRIKSVTRSGISLAWPATGRFSSRGTYIVTASDKAGNVATYKFIIR